MNTSESVGPEAFSRTAHEIPENEYVRRLGKRKQQLANIRGRHKRLWMHLTVVALSALVVAWAALSSHLISALWVLPPSVVGLSIIQSLTKNARAHGRAERIACFYELGLLRLRNEWQGRGIDGKEFLPDNHIYASDLDLFGEGSLFELLCTARTASGRATLANWLLDPVGGGRAGERQVAILELRDMLELREDWASVGGSTLDRAGSSVSTWAELPALDFPSCARALAIGLPSCLILLSLLAAVGVFDHHWIWVIAAPMVLEALMAALLLKKTRLTVANVDLPSVELVILSPLIDRMETAQFQCPLLKSLQSQLMSSSRRPSREIRLLRIWTWLLNLRKFEYFALVSSTMLWGTNLAILIESWRQQNRNGVAQWLDSLGQFEALLCLARYYYENPDHTFAVLSPESSPMFQAEGLGHPLLDRKTCVRCDIALDARSTQLIVVSGSNMSGKSTLLRSVGLNCVLALAGAPVSAARLQISPLQIGCSISVHDSLLQAKSRFQAEVERLKWIIALSRTDSILFLMDEMLGGTNSADRLFGARAVIEQLAANRAIGLVTTHDLALTDVVLTLDGRAINVHFEEHYENEQMRFDYRMRPGVLTRTNGVNVMTALGLLTLPTVR
jgi:hypothetical protein